MGVAGGILVLITILYVILNKKMQKSEYKQLQKLRQGTKANKFSMEILYYIFKNSILETLSFKT